MLVILIVLLIIAKKKKENAFTIVAYTSIEIEDLACNKFLSLQLRLCTNPEE